MNLMKALCCQAAAAKCCEGSLQHPESIPASPWTLAVDGWSPALHADERASTEADHEWSQGCVSS